MNDFNKYTLLLCVFILCSTIGCSARMLASPVVSPPSGPPQLQSAEEGWWAVRFRMDRPDNETRWEKDLLLAHRIVAPIIAEEEENIGLWRFHRRSNNDAASHQFSFIFYSTAVTADRIYRRVMDDALVTQLLHQGVVQRVVTDALDRNERPAVGDTSDPSWSPVMRNAWPHYIMGVSRMWLAMVDQVSRENGAPESTLETDLLAHYQRVNAEVTRIWQQEGYHALLHHLNAIYGYEPMVYWEKRWKSF
ncbi:hypothetical protein [Desulfosarcina ovata]|uniref:Lipoprotein n=1 Tax=Desulfosarcina ovata subsp. ovata TaxID=2752305 RepID=A0A5K8ADW3_9BACT|nr:hypothetical protein [Desulfosarcina ovata]BBO90873.1 hypothetical protein DSCOOX_40530 [Desulfosarcina ovata subsp. ovata]